MATPLWDCIYFADSMHHVEKGVVQWDGLIEGPIGWDTTYLRGSESEKDDLVDGCVGR